MATIDPSTLSVQLYTVREALAADVDGTLARLAAAGFRHVEPFSYTEFPGLGKAMADNGITAPTAHINVFGTEPEAAFDAAVELGVQTVIDPYAPYELWDSADSIRRVADEINRLGAVAASRGLAFGYHNHAFELSARFDDTTGLEIFAEALDPAIRIELDTYWAAAAGEDVPALLHRLGDRVVALHVKDGPGTMEDLDQVAVGKGDMPIASFLAAAPDALWVIELDDSRDDRFVAVEESLAYLSRLSVPA